MFTHSAWKRIFLSASTLMCLFVSTSAASAQVPYASAMTSDLSLEQGFRTPPASARPWVMWMWLRVHTTHAAITKDLEEMHAKGIEGAIIYESGVAWPHGGGLPHGVRPQGL